MGDVKIVPNLRPNEVSICTVGKSKFDQAVQYSERVNVGNNKDVKLNLSNNCQYTVEDKNGRQEPVKGKNIYEARKNAVAIAEQKKLAPLPEIIPKSAPPYGDKPPILKLP